MTDIEKLISRRKSLRASVTRDTTFAKDNFAQVTHENSADAEVFLAKLTRQQTQRAQIDSDILHTGTFSTADAATECDQQQAYADALLDQIGQLEVKLRRMNVANVGLVSSPGATSTADADKKTKVKIPKLELTKFDGDPLHWEEFWDDFTCSVDSRTDLSTIDKFKLLKQSLKNEALSVADGYFLTQRNYQEVKDALQERFGDPQVAIFAHFEALLELRPASHEVDQLSQIRDKCEAHIRSLAALGLSEDTFGLVFAPIILSKLPRFAKMEMHRRNGSQRWTLAALREHLKEEIRVRAKSDRAFNTSSDPSASRDGVKSPKSGKRPSATTSTLFVQGGKGKAKKGQGTSTTKSSPKPLSCVFCQGSHKPWDCSEYSTAEARLPRIQGRCFACLSDKHIKKDCKSIKKCFYCRNSGHHSSLCYSKFSTAQPNNTDQSGLVQVLNPTAPEFVPNDSVHAVQTLSSANTVPSVGKAILESAVVTVSGSKSTYRARVIFDNGSTASFVRTFVAKKVGAPAVAELHTQMSKFGDSSREAKKYSSVKVSLHLRDGSELVVSLRQVPTISAPMQLVPIPVHTITSCFDASEFADLVVEHQTAEIDILLGLDYYYDIVGPEIWRFPNGVIVKDTTIGKIVTGYLRESPAMSDEDHHMLTITSSESEQDLFNLERFWRIEDIAAVEKTVRPDDEVAVELFNKSVSFVNGRYEVKWPFKEDPPNLPVNYDVALRRLVSVHRKLKLSPELLSTYHQIFSDQLEAGIIEEAPINAEGPVHFLPHHAVILPLRETTKVRLVFDASSKPNTHFQSLNESMYRGPVFLNDLCGLLLRFRHYIYAVTSDVQKAFLQISLHVSHRDCTRFIWLRDPSKSVCPDNMVVYRYTRVLFGATASPFLLAATIIHHMKLANTEISRRIIDSAYMDNIIQGHSSTQGLIEYYQGAKQLASSMNMKLHQWYSNNGGFLESIPEDERGTRTVASVLGLKWDTKSDTLACTVGKPTTPKSVTKRGVLRHTASVYDPCGWFSPVTITGKMLMQQLWEQRLGWDEELPPDLAKQWDLISKSFDEMQQCVINRRYSWPADAQISKSQLHTFCDASMSAYCAVVFLRVESSRGIFCTLLFGKSRVAPLKNLTIPKLELEAVRLGKRLTLFVEKHMKIPISTKTLWTDSDCALCWIESDKVKTSFVQNRVREIRSVPGLQCRFVPSENNPADIGSRGTSTGHLSETNLWWTGPSFLYDQTPQWPERSSRKSVVPEVKEENSHFTMTDDCVQPDVVFDLNRFSTLPKLLRVTAYVRRACSLFRGQVASRGNVSVAEIKHCLEFWVHRIQSQHFDSILSGSVLSAKLRNLVNQLGLFVGEKGVIRCRGRFHNSSAIDEDAKFPIILPNYSPFTDLVIRDCHLQIKHYGVKHTLAKMREHYWVSSGRQTVKRVITKCRLCRIHGEGSFPIPSPPPLPDFRSSIKKPFSCIGLDYFGPLIIRDGTTVKQAWVCLFTCAVTRLVHLEVVSSLSAYDFLLALRRFTALYGCPQLIVSDNARQFKAADRMLKREFQKFSQDDSVTDFLTGSGITWKYIIERAPWMGGFYERLVGVVKEGLKKSVGKWTLTSEELATICYEVSFVVNSRPLLYAEDDPSDTVLTPLDFLFRSKRCFPDMSGEDILRDHITKADELLMHWRAGQNLLSRFWDEWKFHYLFSLREASLRTKQPGTSGIPVAVGAVVLIRNDNLPRGQWQIGRINQLHKSADGNIRSASVRLPSGSVLGRPIKLLYPIESDIESQSDASSRVGQDQQNNNDNTPQNTDQSSSALARPKRKAAQTAQKLNKQILSNT